MKKLFFIPIFCLLQSATACQTPDNGENDAPEELVEKSMEQLIEDLQSRLLTAGDYESYDGDTCIKPFGEIWIGNDTGAKFSDMGLHHHMAFYADGTCRCGYSNHIIGGCTKGDSSHPKLLYDTWQWSYDIDAKTITITAPDLSEKGYVNPTITIKVLSYKGNKVLIEGKLPGSIASTYRLRYNCKISPHKDRHSFEANYKDEDDYPCCKQY